MHLKSLKNIFYKIEPLVFFAIVIVNLLPLFSGKYFPTLDGASHLYNANIIKELILHPEGVFASYFEFNPSLVPNWSGHFILAFFQFFFPAFIAEKCLLLIYLIGLPYAFRSLVSRLNPNNTFGAYLIFPFCYTSVFLLGFYNFSIGILFMFLSFSIWFKIKNNPLSFKNYIQLTSLFILIYFSHLVVFLIALGIIIGEITFSYILKNLSRKSKAKHAFKLSIRDLGFVVVSAIIPIILFIQYFLSRNIIENSKRLPINVLNEQLLSLNSLIGFNYELEKRYTFFILCCIISMIIYIFYNRMSSFFSKNRKRNSSHNLKDFWLLSAIGVLALYYILPNEGGSAGFISVRLNLFFYLFLICWIVSNHIPKYFLIAVSIVFYLSNLSMVTYYTSVVKDLNKYVSQIENASSYIENGSTVIPLNLNANWLTTHFSNYLGIDKPLIVLDNYESTLEYFPIRWSGGEFPNIVLDTTGSFNPECISWLTNPYGNLSGADYVFVLGNEIQTECSNQLLNNALESYKVIYVSTDVRLLKHI